ncbi:hypothetical protein P0Y31_15270 [Knoellia sp. 3-2P3]|uniref:hypothetical protein n=1 Tax=unclassified Knoellia TaxID=2618719 RepID=UPI0023DBA0DA|nr:hypothetical protein [Knoellia sp. 3-2P3]MDF2093711.1 hypothetical protein [Knoellia sp. 3-2P3]
MGRVDVGDDSIRRFVVSHYRYDPERHERRHVVVAAFDNEREFEACVRSIQADIDRRQAAGEPVDRNEHATGRIFEPGHLRRAATGHPVRRMIEHGVDPRPWVAEENLPYNMALLGPGMAAEPVRGPAACLVLVMRRWLRVGGRS